MFGVDALKSPMIYSCDLSTRSRAMSGRCRNEDAPWDRSRTLLVQQ